MRNSTILIILGLLTVNFAIAEDNAAKMTATIKVASDKEPNEVAQIRQYYTQISKRAKNRKNLFSRTDMMKNTISVLYDNEKMVFYTFQSPPQSTTQTYSEFLFDKQMKLVFAYDNQSWTDERGQLNSQLRCYWHNEALIHSKIKGDLSTTCDDLLKEANHFRDFADF